MYNEFNRGFDPIWGGHKKDIPTVTKYLNVSSRVYYVVSILSALYIPFFLKNDFSDASFSLLPFFIPPAALLYLLQVYRQYWYLAPAMSVRAKVIKYLFGLWMVLFLLINVVQIIFPSIAVNSHLFFVLGFSVTFSLLTWVVNIVWGIIGELLLGSIKKLAR